MLRKTSRPLGQRSVDADPGALDEACVHAVFGIAAPVERVYLAWTDPALLSRWMAPGNLVAEATANAEVGGTYRIGFGQRLTFDVTDQVTPNGFFGDYELRRDNELGLRCRRGPGELQKSPCPSAEVARVTPDYAWTNRLAGVAAGLKGLSVGRGWLQAYAWGSYQVHRIAKIFQDPLFGEPLDRGLRRSFERPPGALDGVGVAGIGQDRVLGVALEVATGVGDTRDVHGRSQQHIGTFGAGLPSERAADRFDQFWIEGGSHGGSDRKTSRCRPMVGVCSSSAVGAVGYFERRYPEPLDRNGFPAITAGK